MNPLAQLRVVSSLSRPLPMEQYTDPPGDPGLFGPDSVAWRVHADPSLAVGGLSALMLQTLHPLAMAGVAQHSNFRDEPLERLARTGAFVRATVFGSVPVAEAMIEHVRQVHTRVRGVAPDGRPYAASDPDLLRWVHVAEVTSIVRAQRRYSSRPIRGADVDRYYDEMAVIAERLGATAVPRSRGEVARYFEGIRPQLAKTEEVIATIDFLTRPATGSPPLDAVLRLVATAAVDVLPAWARQLLGVGTGRVELAAVRPITWALLGAARLLGPPPPVREAVTRATAVRD